MPASAGRINLTKKVVHMPPRSLRSFTVLPHLPDRLQGLQKLAYNLWWCWNHEAVALFRRIDDQLFDKLENSPVKLLASIDQDRLEQLLHDDGFLAHMDRVVEGSTTTWPPAPGSRKRMAATSRIARP